MAKVAVIIPCYNQEEYLYEALDSLRGDFKDFEVIVINDGSTSSDAITTINNICAKFPDLDINLIHQENKGVCAARNTAIKLAKSDYILPLDADDKIENSYLDKASKILENNLDIGIVGCNTQFYGDYAGVSSPTNLTLADFLISNKFTNSSMFRKKDWEKIGGYKLFFESGVEDWDLWLTLLETGLKATKIDQVLFYYRKKKTGRCEIFEKRKFYFRVLIYIVHFKSLIKNLIPIMMIYLLPARTLYQKIKRRILCIK